MPTSLTSVLYTMNYFLKYSISDTNNTINKATNANANSTPSIEAGIELPIIYCNEC